MLLDVDRGEDVVLHQTLVKDDGVLVVVAFPRHERDEQVAAKGHFSQLGRRTVGDDLTLDDAITLADDRLLVEARSLIGAVELLQSVGAVVAVILSDGHEISRDLTHRTGLERLDHVGGVIGSMELHAGADQRRLGTKQRNCLALHVGAHERAIGVVVLEERDHRGGH